MGYRDIRNGEEAPRMRAALGGVVIAMYSPTRTILIREEWRVDPRYKFPGGHIERKKDTERALDLQETLEGIVFKDALVIAAAMREAFEETGVWLCPEQVILHRHEDRNAWSYRPYLCLAQVSEEQLDMHDDVTYEEHDPARPARVFEFRMDALLLMRKRVLEEHHGFLHHVVRAWRYAQHVPY